MEFTYNQKRERPSAAQRSVAVATRGMVSSSQPLATAAGLRILQNGGNAVDAAVAMAATLNVVEPHSVGIGGDTFALIYLARERKLIGINGSGRAPYGASIDWFTQHDMKEIPERGIYAVTVPGALHAWGQAMGRYGTLPLAAVLEDAIHNAEEGFPVTEVIAGEWRNMEDILRSNEGTARTYLVNGKAPAPGHRFRNPDLGRTFRTIAREGVGAFYEGDVRDAILRCSERLGGLLTEKDFLAHATTLVEPISTDYRGYTVWELPPNGQGLTALQILNILEGYDVAGAGHNSPEYLHLVIESKKAAFSDRDAFLTDPEFEHVPVDRLLSKDYARAVRDRIDARQAKSPPPPLSLSGTADTVYVTAVDKERNAVSFISSIFQHFGSGVVVDGTGILLQNRGSSFSLDPRHFNRLEPHKRPMHTIIPAMVFKDEEFLMSFGVVGADMQPQGQVQFLVNLIDFKMNLQEAMDAPRARHMKGMEVHLEAGIGEQTASRLRAMGHQVSESTSPINEFGGGQAIYLDRANDVLLGASDRRKDGCSVGY
jgi:gamma-glutamyltranspeptidase / glutathione hydrolase